MEEGPAVEVMTGGLKREEEEEEGEEKDVGIHKRRRVGEKEERRKSEVGLVIEKLSLACLEDQKHVSTSTFLDVSNLLLMALDKVVPNMPVLRQDIQRNIERLESFYVLKPSIYNNLLEILKKEADEKISKKQDSCSRSVVWLTRSMNFSLDLMESLSNDADISLEEAVEKAYNNNFRPWHGWITSAAYKVALQLIPDRKTFNELLMGERQDYNLLKNDTETLISLLHPFLDNIRSHLHELLDKYKAS